MANEQRDKIEYEFDDLRRNSDPIPGNVLEQLGLDEEDLTEDERQDDESDTDDREELDDTDDDLADDGDYKPAKMTGAMRKRLMKVKQDGKREVAAAKAEAGETIGKLEQRIESLEKAGKTESLDNEFNEQIGDLEGRIEAAMESGDSKEVVKLTRELSELTADNRMKRRDLEREEADDTDDTDTDVKIMPRAQQWLDDQDWWDDQDYGHVRAYVRKADMALQKKGYRPTDDDFYEQLEALVDKKFPNVINLTMSEDDLDEDDLDEDDDLDLDDELDDIPAKKKSARRARKKRARRTPVSEGDRGGVSRSKKKLSRKKGKTLTKARVRNMQMFGLDPENPEHVEAYLEGV